MTQLLECINPGQVNEEDYLAAINNEAPAQFTAHVAQCEYCQVELAQYRSFDRQMHQQFAFISSPARALCHEPQQIGEYIIGMLKPVEQAKLEQHLASCQHCTAEIASMRDWLLGSDELIESSQTLATSGGSKWNWLRRIIATLVITDAPGVQPTYALAGVRGSSDGLPATYQAEEISVTVTVQATRPQGKEFMVLGLVQRDHYPLDAVEGAEVRLVKNDTLLATETIDELGNFIFPVVTTSDPFDLEIALDDRVVMVQNLNSN